MKKIIPPGTIYECSDPENIGRLEVKQEIEVIPADEPKKPIGFIVREYSGAEVFKIGNDGKVIEESLLKEEDILHGMKLLVPTLVGEYIMTVVGNGSGAYAETGGMIALLEFNKDDRHCWITTCAINKKCLK